MAVQQRKKSGSRTRMKRSHQAIQTPAVMVNSETGEAHLRHHIDASGTYRGRQVITRPSVAAESDHDDVAP